VGVQEPSLGGRRDPKSSFFLVFSFTNIILAIGDMSLIGFFCSYVLMLNSLVVLLFLSLILSLFFYVSFSNPFLYNCLA
jgi:hypothetical protein